jgi:hypothetical protein
MSSLLCIAFADLSHTLALTQRDAHYLENVLENVGSLLPRAGLIEQN